MKNLALKERKNLKQLEKENFKLWGRILCDLQLYMYEGDNYAKRKIIARF